MDKQTLSQYISILICLLIVLIIVSTTYKYDGKNFLTKTTTSTADSKTNTIAKRLLQCNTLTPTQNSFQHSTNHNNYENEEWRILKLRLNATDSGIFPFPKVYESNPEASFSQLQLHENFDITIYNEDIKHINYNEFISPILNRYCTTTMQTIRTIQPNFNIITINHIEIIFIETNLLETSTIMKNILNKRSKETKENAYYIDEEMYSIDISKQGHVKIHIHSSRLYNNIYRGLANALASLDQILTQSIPIQLPLAILDWPDNHWRGE